MLLPCLQVKSSLRPDVQVYVEWSNEVWHTGFPGEGLGRPGCLPACLPACLAGWLVLQVA